MHSIIFRLACCRPVVADRSKAGICSHVSCGRFYYYSVYICLREREREYFSPTMSKITHFFAPTSSGSGKRSNASSTSGNNNNKDEEDEPLEPPPKRSLKSKSSEATEARCASSKKSSVSSSAVEGIIKDLFTEDQKKVLHHYHCCRERNCSGLGTDEKQRLSSKKDKFQQVPLGQIVSVTSNHATDNVYSPQAVKTLMYWTLYEHLLFICYKMHCLFMLLKRLTRNEY